MIALKVLTRILAVVGKETLEVVRRPRALVSLILGPFLIMALFGIGYSATGITFRTVLVVPADSGLSTSLADYAAYQTTGAELVAVMTDVSAARAELQGGTVDVVIIAPGNMYDDFAAGRQSKIEVEYDLIDPTKANYALVFTQQIAYGVNQQIIRQAAAKGVAELDHLGATNGIPPAVIAAPTVAVPVNLAPVEPTLTSFFGPAVLALIVQHVAVTLSALSLVRERQSGIFDVFRVSPVNAFEIVLGKVVSFGFLVAIVAGSILAFLVLGLRTPMLGDVSGVVSAIALVLVASLGLGLLISVVSDSERQAVQLSLLVLLGSIFFSGLVLDLNQFVPLVRVVGYLLPVTHGLRLLQDLMLRGGTNESWHFAALASIAVVTLVPTWLLVRRAMSTRP